MTARFSASRWLAQAAKLEATHASLFAAPIRMILARTPPDTPPIGLDHVWFAQSLGAEHHSAFARLVGTPPRQLYGMTETIAAATTDKSEPAAPDLIGTPVGDRKVALLDPQGRAVRPGGAGEIHVAGTPGRDLFLGYLDDPAATARTLITRGGETWLRTGDLAVTAAGDSWKFVGRADDVIKVSGENVSLTEVEAIAAQAPGVLEVAVVARPDDIADQVPVAFYIPRDPQSPPDESSLARWVRDMLPSQAWPRSWHPVEELPRTSVGKVRRHELRARVQNWVMNDSSTGVPGLP
ncbi:class I adenylate-forming enzyme family protein [Amycolatopsis pithecellobii]|uniref:class I adenylate-forming enzyme family protein n=1 Tax=Amycolatopsis pithecellobii TaxID=664692 RepID=UPI001AA02101|nr:AMP-binding protein [Amycolatopsis pithecellobii]